MPCTREMFFLILLNLFLAIANSNQQVQNYGLQIYTFDEFSNFTIVIYQNGILNPAWNHSIQNSQHLNCCGKNSYPIEYASTQKRKFEVKNYGTEPIIIQKIELFLNENILQTSISSNIPLEISPQNKESFDIDYLCKVENIVKNNLDGWSNISIKLTTFHENTIQFQYLKICSLENKESIDWSLFVLFIIAIIIIVIGSQQNYSLIVDASSQEDHIKSKHYIFFLVLTSGALITFYLFNEIAGLIISIIFSISAVTVLSILFSEFLESYTSSCKLCQRRYDLRCCGKFTIPEMISFLASITLVCCWYVTRHWAFNNLIGFGIVIIVLKAVKISSFKTVCIVLSICFCYDIFWVFISKLIFGQSVMMANVTNIEIPIKLEWPYFMTMPVPMCSILGLGDIVFPGFLVTFNYRYGIQKKTLSYFWGSIFAYIISLFVCGLVMVKTSVEQPALLYIVPLLIFSTILISIKRKELREIWEGIEDEYQYHNMKDFANSSDSYQLRISMNEDSITN